MKIKRDRRTVDAYVDETDTENNCGFIGGLDMDSRPIITLTDVYVTNFRLRSVIGKFCVQPCRDANFSLCSRQDTADTPAERGSLLP